MRSILSFTTSFRSNCLFLVLCYLVSPACTFWWKLYPACAHSELEKNGPPECDIANDRGVKCLCESHEFLAGSAKDIWQKCGCEVLQISADTAAAICEAGGFQIALNKTEMLAVGDGGEIPCAIPDDGTFPNPDKDGADTEPRASLTPSEIILIAAVVVFFIGLLSLGYYKWQQREKTYRSKISELEQERYSRWENQERQQLIPSHSDADQVPSHMLSSLTSQSEGSVRLD